MKQPNYEDDLKNKEDLKNGNNLKNEDELKNEELYSHSKTDPKPKILSDV